MSQPKQSSNQKIVKAQSTAPPKVTPGKAYSSNAMARTLNEGLTITTKNPDKNNYEAMLVDGTALALYRVSTNPLLGVNWSIIPPDTNDAVGVAQAEFCEEVLRKPAVEGGMTTSFDLVRSQFNLAKLFGYAPFEKVYQIVEGRYTLRKLVYLSPETTEVLTDEKGGFNGFRQYFTTKDGKQIDIYIPTENCFLFTRNKEMNSLTGKSDFIAVYDLFKRRRRLGRFMDLGAQRLSVPARIIKFDPTIPGGTYSNKTMKSIATKASRLAFQSSITLPIGYSIEADASENALAPMLKIYDTYAKEMARSLLAPFITLQEGGSYALSKDQSSLFLQLLESDFTSTEAHMNDYILPDIYRLNFGDNAQFGKLKFDGLDDDTVETIRQAFMEILKNGQLTPAILEQIVSQQAKQLGLTINPEDDLIMEKPQPTFNFGPADSGSDTQASAVQPYVLHATNPTVKLQEKLTDSLITKEVPVANKIAADFDSKLTKLLDKSTSKGQVLAELSIGMFDDKLIAEYEGQLVANYLRAYRAGNQQASEEVGHTHDPASIPDDVASNWTIFAQADSLRLRQQILQQAHKIMERFTV